jgi:hypothetical protein
MTMEDSSFALAGQPSRSLLIAQVKTAVNGRVPGVVLLVVADQTRERGQEKGAGTASWIEDAEAV